MSVLYSLFRQTGWYDDTSNQVKGAVSFLILLKSLPVKQLLHCALPGNY
ncbi:hypothetical protein REC12_19060 [Desulfosporosinus sp. PR]|nr:hypothetical protein [Desulfosporosinus sp. PR]